MKRSIAAAVSALLLLVSLIFCFAGFTLTASLGVFLGQGCSLFLTEQELGRQSRTAEPAELVPAAVNDPVAFWAM